MTVLFFLTMLLAAPAVCGLLLFAWVACRRWPRRCPRCGGRRAVWVAHWECDLWECRACGHAFCYPE